MLGSLIVILVFEQISFADVESDMGFLAYSYAVCLFFLYILVKLVNVSALYWKSLQRKKSTVN